MFEKLYEMYHNGDEAIYDYLSKEVFEELYHECYKNLAKFYEFSCWLESIEEYY